MTAAGVAIVPNDFEAIVKAVRRIGPDVRAATPAIESIGHISSELIQRVKDAGVYRIGFSKETGGPGLSASQQARVIAELSYFNSSVGWCAMVGMDAGLFANYMAPSSVERIFPSIDICVAGMLAPKGIAREVPGGYLLSGNWQFASGIEHAQLVFAGAHVVPGGNEEVDSSDVAEWRIFWVSKNDAVVNRRWNTTGLAGSASHDFSTDNVLVEHCRSFSFAVPNEAVGPLSSGDLQMRKMPGVPIGIARAALDYARARVIEKPHDYRSQYILGECEMKFLSMAHGVYRSLDEHWEELAKGKRLSALSPGMRVSSVLARTSAFRLAREIVVDLFSLLGPESVYSSSPMDGWLRDMDTISQHYIAQDKVVQSAGAFLLGGTMESPLAMGEVRPA